MNNKSNGMMRTRKHVEVRFVSDEVIGTIITDEEPIQNNHSGERYHSGRYRRQCEYSSTSRGKYTRAGRHITNRFESLSIADSPEKKQRSCQHKEENKTDPSYDEGTAVCTSDSLFGEGDVEGRAMFSFKTEKRQNSMLFKATESVSRMSFSTPKSQSKKSLTSSSAPKTPYALRDKIKKVLVDEVTKLELDRLLENSGSDYVPSSDESASESSNESEDSVHLQSEDISKETTPKIESKEVPLKRTKKQISNFRFTTEEYFDRQYNKVITSNHTLNKLKTPRLAQTQLNALLKSLAPGHKQALRGLQNEIETSFKRWLFSLNEGYNILLYGLGSKREILKTFQEKYLSRNFVIVVNGYFPDLSLKEMLDYIAVDMLGMTNLPSQLHEVVELISGRLASKSAPRIFILFNNIEGPMVRNDKAQDILSQLAHIPKIHMIATVDHVNCPLLWDQKKMSSFNFIWEDATIFAPYIEETSFEDSLMVQRSGGLALAALKNVYQSLTNNSRKVFKLLLKHQLDKEDNKYSGMHFSELYRECRSKFIVSSDLALRTLLTEFLDHELVKWKKDTDQLVISIQSNILKQFQLEMDTLER